MENRGQGPQRKCPILRLYLVRHAETKANAEGLVVGQSHSPLTEKGRCQALALRKSKDFMDMSTTKSFWRIYTSDLERAIETCSLVVEGCRTAAGTSNIFHDKRLRELGKGAREGFPKHFRYEEAVEARQRLGTSENIPLNETEADGWRRFHSWLSDLVNEIHNDGSNLCTYNVLVVSHAGLLREAFIRLLGQERVQSFPHDDRSPKRLIVPNTSVTILDVHIVSPVTKAIVDISNPCKEDVVIRKFASADHCESVEKSCINDC